MKLNTNKILVRSLKKAKLNLKKSIERADAQILFKNDVRGSLFVVEGILRLFLKGKEKFSTKDFQIMNSSFFKIKNLEDKLGKFSLAYEMKDYAQKESFSKQTIKKIDNFIFKEKIEFFKYLQSEDVLTMLETLIANFKEITWPKKESQCVIRLIDKEVKKTERKSKILGEKILSPNYTYFELEEGFHEWRRKIRWISIYIQAYKNLFRLKFKRKKDKIKYDKLIKEYKDSPFCKLADSNYKSAINAVKFYQLSDYIKKIGDIKSKGELPYVFSRSLNIEIKTPPIEKEAHKIYLNFLKDKVFKKMIL